MEKMHPAISSSSGNYPFSDLIKNTASKTVALGKKLQTPLRLCKYCDSTLIQLIPKAFIGSMQSPDHLHAWSSTWQTTPASKKVQNGDKYVKEQKNNHFAWKMLLWKMVTNYSQLQMQQK